MADIAANDGDFDDQAAAWLTFINGDMARWGITPTMIAPANAAKTQWDLRYAEHKTFQLQAKVVTASKDEARKARPNGLEPQLRTLRQLIAAHPATTDADRAALGTTNKGWAEGCSARPSRLLR